MKLCYLLTRYRKIILIFLLLFTIFITSYFFSNKSLLIDIPLLTMCAVNNKDTNILRYMYVVEDVSRFFSYILGVLYFNVVAPFITKATLLDLNKIFSISYIITPFFAIIFNFYISSRSKRYDIAIITFFIYSFFSLPGIIWTPREIQIAFILWFALFQYFLTKQKLKLLDYLIVGFLCIYSFESYELFCIIGFMFFIYSLKNMNNEKIKNRKLKLFIGISSLVASFYILFKFFFKTSETYDIYFAPYRYYTEIINTIQNIFELPILISTIGVIILPFVINNKVQIYNKVIYCFWIVLSVLILVKNQNIYVKEFDYCALLYVIPIIVIFYILITKDLKIKKSYLCKLFFLSLIVGCLQFTYQIKSNIEYYHYFSSLKTFLKNAQSQITYLPENYIDTFNRFEYCTDISLKSLILQENNIKTILFPTKGMKWYDKQVCKSMYYNKENNEIEIYKHRFDIKTKYWDFSSIKESIPQKSE